MKSCLLCLLLFFINTISFSQIDTAYLFNPAASFGPLDIRISKSSSQHYYLEEGKTFSFRESHGVKTDTYKDMTAWDSHSYQEGNMRQKSSGNDLFVMNYRLLKPQTYNESYTEGYPLVILLHGLLEGGNCSDTKCYHGSRSYTPNANIPPANTADDNELLNNDYNLVHGGVNYMEAHTINGSTQPNDPSLDPKAFPGFVVFPQNLNGWDESAAEDAIRLVRLLVKKYNIDENRIYINGVSNGGHGAYEVMKRAPWLFAAGVLFSAADDANIISQNMATTISHIPLWLFQGGKDAKPSSKKTEGYIKHLRNAGAVVRYTLYPELGHGTWNNAFNEPDFFSWMLRQRKNDIHVFADNPVLCKTSGSGALLALPDGYKSYQWEYNDQVIEQANDAHYTAKLAGSYRGRFSIRESDGSEIWNDWSQKINVTEKDPIAPGLKQFGTILLKDPNNSENAILEAEAGYAHYYWHKDGVLLNFPGDEDDTLKRVILKPAYNDGVYHLEVAGFDNCKSPSSLKKHIFFNNRAPVNITSPIALRAESTSPSEVQLTWQDVADNENGFEIWRRRKVSENGFTPWTMVMSEENSTSFIDQDLLPSSTFQYMIRAISNSGRSNYDSELTGQSRVTVTTLPDTTPPGPPLQLKASQVAVKTIKLEWKRSIDNSSIREYYIYSATDTFATGSNDSIYLLKGLDINTHYSFYVKAVDVGNNLSEASNEVKVYTGVDGLFYEHSTGAWNVLDEVDWSIAEFKGVVDNFTLAPKTQEDFFNFRFDGYVNIETNGVYQFRISSDDGSRLFLDDSLLVANDGIHNLTTITGPIQVLSEGPHRIMVEFFDAVKSDTLIVEYKGPDSNNEWVVIPSERLRSTLVTSIQSSVENNFSFSIYPNPASSGNINIKILSNSHEPIHVSMLGNTGQLLFQKIFDIDEGTDEFTLSDYKTFSEGFYIIAIRQGKTRLTEKVIIK